jgi:hypothetical protein
MKLTYNQKYKLKAAALLIISPIYVPVMILWDNQRIIWDFYKETYKILRGTHPDLKEETDG